MRTAMVLGVLLLGCGGDNGPCAPRVGLYRWTLVQQSGNCGPLPEHITDGAFAITPSSGCAGSVTVTGDKCTETTQFRCDDAASFGEENASLTWARDGESGAGIIELRHVLKGVASACSSIYGMTARRP
jgi:hypothetical protein